MSESERRRKLALECLRLESDCRQLAGAAGNRALQTHLLRMADIWSGMAHRSPTPDTDGEEMARRERRAR